MANPWLKKNPFMSMWLSTGNRVAGTLRGKATAQAKRRDHGSDRNACAQGQSQTQALTCCQGRPSGRSGARQRHKEAHHFRRLVRAGGVRVGAAGVAARPGVPGTVQGLALDQRLPGAVCVNGAAEALATRGDTGLCACAQAGATRLSAMGRPFAEPGPSHPMWR